MSLLATVTVLTLTLPITAADPPQKTTEARQEEAAWKKLDEDGINAFNKGNYAAATKYWMEALDLARRLYPKDQFPDGHVNLAKSIHNLGLIYKLSGKLADAEPLYREVIAMRRQLNRGQDEQELARSINNLGLLLQAQGKFADAEPHLREALAMRKRLFKDEHGDVAASLNCLAVLNYDQGRYREAEPLARAAVAIYKHIEPQDSVDHLFALNNLGNLHGLCLARRRHVPVAVERTARRASRHPRAG